MANEVFTRTPTSSGNRKKFTWAGWIKRNLLNSQGGTFFNGILGVGLADGAEDSFMFSGDQLRLRCETGTDIVTADKYRDCGNWIHVMMVVDTTLYDPDHRCIFYVNGVKSDVMSSENDITQNADLRINSSSTHYLGEFPRVNEHLDSQITDVFLVDGQALTPDVFGFYKDGDGYQSSGTTNATDFRPGQWSPRLPRSIKHTINRSGGFGVNGYYLPMNDSSNPGADFHCAPNSIITLKGEDLPQPRNGAPTTSDAFVSELRQETGTLGFDGVVAFDGTGDYLTPPSNTDFTLGTGDFTIECWVYPKTYGGIFQFFDSSVLGNSTSGPSIGIDVNDNSWAIRYGTSSTLDTDNIATLNMWYHIAYVRNSSVTKLYVNGKEIGSVSDSTDYSANYPVIGGWYNTSFLLNGFISNFRVVKGTAVYTANFTPSTEPLTNVTNTKLLCCNSSTSATAATVTPGTITANGNPFATRNELTGSTVLAVPGISTSTSANLITNGTFDSNISGWTTTDNTQSWNNGQLQINRSGGAGATSYQAFTTEVGKRYTVKGTVNSSGSRGDLRIYDGTGFGGTPLINLSGTSGQTTTQTGSFTATSTTTSLGFSVDNNNTTIYVDNIIVKQEDAPRDYSADIKGSGTNKTLTAAGNAGVGYELGGYYGSAMTFDGADATYFNLGNDSDFDFGTGDFTIEFWRNRNSVSDTESYFTKYDNGETQSFWFGAVNNGRDGFYWYDTNGEHFILTSDNTVVASQYDHLCAERHNGTVSLYVNGVSVGISTLGALALNTTTDNVKIGANDDDNGTIYYPFDGEIQDLRVYKGVAKYKGGFDVPKPYTPVGIEAFRTTADTCKNNFVTMNSLNKNGCTLSNGNLTTADSTSNGGQIYSTMGSNTGKWYYEAHVTDVGSAAGTLIGINPLIRVSTNGQNRTAYRSSGDVYSDGSTVQTGTTYTTGDIIGVAWDADNKKLWFAKNGSWVYSGNPAGGTNPAVTYTNTETQGPSIQYDNGGQSQVTNLNFGQNPTFSGQVTAGTNADGNRKGLFKYAPPTGFLALCEDNLPTPAIADPGDYMRTVLYTGDGSDGRSITGVGFQPDLVWIKPRNAVDNHVIYDAIRGPMKGLYTNNTNQEFTGSGNGLTSFDIDGFSSNSFNNINNSGDNYVAWCWKAGGAAVSNSDGDLTSQVSVNQDAGFSIVKFTGQGGSSSATVGHGLGKKPAFWIYKPHTNTTNWYMYHQSLGASAWLQFNTTAAVIGNAAAWGGVEPTSTVLSHGSGLVNQGSCILYAWAEIEGYSKFGSYTGNGSTDGPFVYCGFKPAWIMIKAATELTSYTSYSSWGIKDSSRYPSNINNVPTLWANESYAEGKRGNGGSDTYDEHFDFLSNGFKIGSSSSYEVESNRNGVTYIFMAFAESPFQTANAK